MNNLAIRFLAFLTVYLISTLPFLIKILRHENVKINKPLEGNNQNVLKAIEYTRENHPNFFNEKIEKLMFLFIDINGNIVDEFLKESEKKDTKGRVMLPWKIIKNDFSKRHYGIITLHSHPRNNNKTNNLMRGSYGDAIVHRKMSKTFKSVTSIVVDKTINNFIEYNDKKNFKY